MSGSGRQIVGGVIGGIVGSFFGMPWLGYSIGSALFAPSIEGPGAPDPGDLSFNTSAYGKFMSWGYGTYKITPVTFWSTDFVAHHHSEEVGGKGGGGGTTREWNTYSRSFALYLRDCTDGQEIIGIRRIWNKFTGELLYDMSDNASAETIIGSIEYLGERTVPGPFGLAWDYYMGNLFLSIESRVRVYTGNTNQDPDPLIEAHEGWAPAHRGHAYVVFENFDHGETKQAMPLEIEVVVAENMSYLVTPALVDRPVYADSFYSSADDGTIAFWTEGAGPDAGGTLSIPGTVWDMSGLKIQDETAYISTTGWTNTYSQAPVRRMEGWFCIQGNVGGFTRYGWGKDGGGMYGPIEDETGARMGSAFGGIYTSVYYEGAIYCITGAAKSGSVDLFKYPVSSGIPSITASAHLVHARIINDVFVNAAGVWVVSNSSAPNRVFVDRCDFNLAILDSWVYSGTVISWPGLIVDGDVAVIGGGTEAEWKVFRLNNDGTMTILAQGDAVGSGASMHPVNISNKILLVRNSLISTGTLGLESDTLPSVAANLCARAGLTAAQYDTSALPATGVRQAITTQRAARDWLAELGQIFGFRMRDSAGVLEFVPKGQASVATLTAEELGFQDPPRTPAPPPISTQRNQGNDLPRAVTVSYPSADADYAPGAQPYRMHNYAQGRDVVVRTSHILTDQAAFNYAYMACKEPHLERLSWATSVGLKRLALEPGDVITLPSGDSWIREIHQRGGTVLELTLQAEAARAYTAPGLPAPTQSSPPVTVKLTGPTRLEILDAPAILHSHTGTGYLVAACGYLSGWSGCALYLSTDGGESYTRFMALNTAAVIGTAVDALGDGAPGALDRANSVTIQMTHGSLASVSLANMYAGQNAAMLGDELIKFAVAEFLGNNQYRISILERGRKGTEWATADHVAGDRFVLLNTAVQRIPINIDDIGKTRLIKAVSYGNDIGDVTAQSFTPTGVSLLPWPPTRARAWQSGSDWEIRCNERTRFGGELRNYVGITRDPEWDGWDLEIMNGTTVVRTVSALASPSFTYTAAMQTSDFGSAQSSITYRWYQRSTVMGRGYVTETTS